MSGAERGPRWSEVTAILGGTFDPPHAAHRKALRGLYALPGVGRVVVMPSASPPHKPAIASPEHRLEMARLAFQGLAPLEIDSSELERARRTGRPSYSFDTISELSTRYPELAFVIGADQLRDLPRWYRFPDILGLCHWIVLARKPDGERVAQKAMAELEASGMALRETDSLWRLKPAGHRAERYLVLVPTDAPALSSTEIREALGRTGKAPQEALPEPVLAYLMRHRLYGTQGNPL